MLNALELRAAAYVVCALGFIYLGAHLSALHYEAIIAKDREAVATVAAQAAVAAKAKEEAASANNLRVLAGIQAERDGAVARSLDFAKRLRDAEARSGHVSAAADKSGTAAAGPQGSPDSLTELLAAAAGECFDNEARQDALIEELKPQL